MSNLKYSLVALVLAYVCATASAGVLYFEDFESLSVGLVLHEEAGWEGWYGDAGAAATVSNKQAFSGTKSVEVDSSADAVRVFDITEGKWVLTVMQYIPSGGTGKTKFHMQNAYRNGAIGRSVQWGFSLSDGAITDDYDDNASASIVFDEWIELRLIIDLDNDLLEQYYDGELFSSHPWLYSGTISQIQSIDLFGNSASTVYYDDIKIQDYLSSLILAHNPDPASDATDVPRDAVFTWTPGRLADTHDVYFGASAEDVANADRSNPLDVLASQGQSANAFDPEGLLDFGQTYYWRIDEVNTAEEEAIIKGDVWTFTAEPFAYPIETITATSNAPSNPGEGPENTINGSGLEENDGHSVNATDMWIGLAGADSLNIQYEFDRIYKLHQMLVWNYNVEFELILGFGFKDVTVEHSLDGAAWTALANVTFAQATAQSGYVYNTTVDFDGAAVKYVRLTLNSGYGSLPVPQFGLSEVRFMYIPAQARLPLPADEANDVSVATDLTWRAGRDAISHEVYFGPDPEALALVDTVEAPGYTPGTLDLGTPYYWKVDAIQEAESWEGDLWTFTTEESIVVDDFESYTDDIDAGQVIFLTWIDGYEIDGNGSQVGHIEAPFAEKTIVHGGRQSMPLFYNNATAATSEAELTLAQDWTASAIGSLSLAFQGAEGNGGQLYAKINGVKVPYPGDAADLASLEWITWTIDLSTVSGDLSNVTSLIIGIEGAGATGVVYIDDVELGS